MKKIKDIISSLFIYSNTNDKYNVDEIYENDKFNANTLKDQLPDIIQHQPQNDKNKLPSINPRVVHIDKKTNNQNYITWNLLLLKQQEACIREMRMSKEKPKTREYQNRAYLHISSRLLNKKQKDQEMRKEYERYNSASRKRNHNQGNQIRQRKLNQIRLQKITQSKEIGSCDQFTQGLQKDFGKIPEYLIKKKEEYREQKEYEKQRNKEKLIPKGMRIVPEQECFDKIKELSNRKKDLEEELRKMPIARISMKLQQRKAEIEESLRVIDNNNVKYSLKTVIIPIEKL